MQRLSARLDLHRDGHALQPRAQLRQWDTVFRTDCTAITKKPLKWGAKNLDAFDAVAFFTDGDLDMDDSQKADLLSFVRDDGKGFIGIHSAAITFTPLARVRQDARRLFRRPSLGRVRRPAGRRGSQFPGMGTCQTFTLKDEIYQIKDFSRDNVRVLLRLDAGKSTCPGRRPSQDGDFAVIWAREYGKGRVLYNGLGHRAGGLGPARHPEDVAGDGALVHGHLPGDAAPRPASAR